MFDLLRQFVHWFESFADSSFAVPVLGVSSFIESIFFPIPPDPLLIAMSLRSPSLAIWFAILVTVTSVLGAIVGHWLGGRFGRPLLLKIVSEHKVDTVERMFQRYGAWAILVAAFTPIPYKVFAITAGILEMDRKTFIIASIIGRGARFLLLGALIALFGESIQEFIDTRFEMVTVAASALMIVALGVLLYFSKRRRPSANNSSSNSQATANVVD